MRIVEEDSIGSPNGHPTVTVGIPCESDTRRKMEQGIRQHFVVGHAGIARKQKSCGSIFENSAPAFPVEPVVLEMQHPAILVALSQEWFPSNAGIHSHTRT